MSDLIISNPPEWGTPESTFCWYDFKSGASILNTTGTAATESNEKYEYIICFDPPCPNAELFEQLAAMLAPGGRLLVALDNKYGLKYWCGTRGGVLRKPFGEIEGGHSMLSGVELRRELNRAGFHSQKWYYPTPDHHFPKAVYSENKLPNPFFASISPIAQLSGTGVLLREAGILPGVIENGAFTFMCNSFIVEAAREPDAVMCPVDFSALTLYRPPSRAFITTVYSDGTARKTAVYPEGSESLRKLTENHKRLIERGIEAVPLTFKGNSVAMPEIRCDTLWDYMQGSVRGGHYSRDEFIRIFDRLRDDILKSAELSPPGSYGWDAELGAVLRYAYTEMIPANCFYDAGRDVFIYFDQEHALENCPFSVPLSRALMSIIYSAELSSHPEIMALLQDLKQRYGLLHCWDKLVEIERKFIGELNDTDDVRVYSKITASANAEISANRRVHDLRTAAVILSKKYKSIGLYGYGKRGKLFAAFLEQLGCPPVFTADRTTGGLQKDDRAGIIVVTPQKDADEIADELRRVTSVPVITIDEISSGPELQIHD